LNVLVKPDQGVHRIAPPQITGLSKQFPFTEGPGIESFTFDEVYSNGSSIKDADTVGTDEESLWQVSWYTFLYGNMLTAHMFKLSYVCEFYYLVDIF
jgi:hypothetical protein